MVTPATLLVLDEPTNHLDIPSKELLEVSSRPYFFCGIEPRQYCVAIACQFMSCLISPFIMHLNALCCYIGKPEPPPFICRRLYVSLVAQ